MNTIEVILSGAVQKQWRIKPTIRASDPPTHWLAQWRVDFGRKARGETFALVTNTATLYTFLLPAAGLAKDGNFERLFRLRLGFALLDAPALSAWKSAPIAFAAGNPRMVIGSMNDMRRLMSWRTEEPAFGPMKDDEDWINKTPYLSLPGHFPGEVFATRLRQSN